MNRQIAFWLMTMVTTPIYGQGVAVFQNGVTQLPGGSVYSGTIDTEFRAAAPTTPQNENPEISIDQFDGGFQTQGAIRFEQLLIGQGGLVPEGLTRNQIVFAELRLWKTSPSDSDANIDFNRIVGKDTTSGDFWEAEDTWASLGGDLIPNEAGLLEGDPISRNGVEAASSPDFKDSPIRFGPTDVVTLKPGEAPVASALVYTTDVDSGDVFDAAWNGKPEDLARAVDVSFWRFNVTETVRDWLADTNAEQAGTQPSQLNLGWAISNDTGNGWDMIAADFEEALGGDLDGFDPKLLRPSLTVIFDDGSAGPLDLNKDKAVNLIDYDVFLNRLGAEMDAPLPTGAAGDFNFDRRIDLADFKYFKQNYPGGAVALQAALAAVPEPTGLGLGLIALSGCTGLIRRRRA